MKRNYDCPKVKPGDWVYFLEDSRYETKYSYKVVMVKPRTITVEVNENKKDSFAGGWLSSSIGNGKYWNVAFWCLRRNILEIE